MHFFIDANNHLKPHRQVQYNGVFVKGKKSRLIKTQLTSLSRTHYSLLFVFTLIISLASHDPLRQALHFINEGTNLDRKVTCPWSHGSQVIEEVSDSRVSPLSREPHTSWDNLHSGGTGAKSELSFLTLL